MDVCIVSNHHIDEPPTSSKAGFMIEKDWEVMVWGWCVCRWMMWHGDWNKLENNCEMKYFLIKVMRWKCVMIQWQWVVWRILQNEKEDLKELFKSLNGTCCPYRLIFWNINIISQVIINELIYVIALEHIFHSIFISLG